MLMAALGTKKEATTSITLQQRTEQHPNNTRTAPKRKATEPIVSQTTKKAKSPPVKELDPS